jgi:thiamine biosynthesis lipoprotein
LHLYAPDDAALQRACAAAEAEVRRIETQYSRYRDDSIVSRINAAAGSGSAIEVDDETAALLDYAATAFAQSGGLFDITSGVLRRVWDFKARRVPAQREIDALKPLIGWDQVEWRRPGVRLPREGMELDFGGFGKEYAADRAAAVLLAQGLRHGLVDLAGDIRVIGSHPDGAPWQVGIQHPRAAGAIATIPLTRGAIASSGDYERGFERDGRRYCHILDPRSGWPVQGLAAVSVLADRCLIAGTACTTAMLLGADDGPRWLADLGLPHLYVRADLSLGGTIL